MFEKVKKYFKKYSLNDYLTKDANGITMLENLLKQGISLSYDEETKIINSIEAGYLYIKYNKSIHRFEYTEEQLFTLMENIYFFEYLCNTKNTSSSMIEKIKEHIEVVDILIKYDKNKLLFINKEIINKLLYKDINNKYLIEKYIIDDYAMNLFVEKIDNGKILLEISNKYKKIEWLKKSNEEALMSKINDNQTLLDYLLNQNIVPNKIKNIPNNKKYIKFLIEKKLEKFLTNLDEKNILNKLDDNKTILELLLEQNSLNELNFSVYSSNTISVLNKYNRLDLLNKISLELLIQPSKKIIGKRDDNKTLLEFLLDNGYNPKFSESIFTEEKEKNLILKILYEREKLELIASSLDNDGLFYSFENDQLLIDKLLERNMNISINGNIELKKLFNNYKDNKTYLEFLLENIKDKRIKYNLMNTSFVDCDINDIALFYITIAKKDMIKYVENLSEEDLLKKYEGKTFLDILLDLDKETTLNKILSDEIKSNLEILIILKSKGINIKRVSFPLLENNFSYDYFKNEQNKYGIGPLQQEGEELLKKLKEKFLLDNNSDEELINALVIGYRRALLNNYNLIINELKNLINIKDNNIRFRYQNIEQGNYFKKIIGSVLCDNISINTLMHETGHALHYFINRNYYPKEFEKVLERTKKNYDILQKVKFISNTYNELKEKTNKIVELKFEEYFKSYYTKERINEINKYLIKIKEEKKKEYKLLGIEEEKIKSIIEEIFTIKEYIKNEKRIIIEEQINIMLYEENGCIIAISDIIDGLFEGALFSEILLDEKNKIIKSSSGHGIPYYSCNYGMIFNEMIANFSVIIKSNNSNEYLEILKITIGEELYNLISNYYFENIIGIEKSKTYKKRYK